MVNLFRAEWIKITGNRWVVGFLIWVFPIGAAALLTIAAVAMVLIPSARDESAVEELGLRGVLWTELAVQTWNIPNGLVGRLILLAFTAVVFAGEYQWHTWKDVVPRTRRWSAILVKFLAVATFTVLAFMLLSVIVVIGMGVLTAIAGESYGPAVTGSVLADFVVDYVQQAWLAFTMTIIAAGYAALAGMVTRSILGGIVVGVLATYAEGLSILILLLISHFLDMKQVVELYRLTPSYNISNVSSWINNNVPQTESANAQILGDIFEFSDSLEFSLVILALWVVGLIGVTMALFEKQDIT